jgi:hypothetical protein
MASKAIGFLNFKFGADLKGFDRAMKKAQKNLKRFGKNIERTGKNLTTGLTLPIAALGAASIKAFDEQQKAIAQVEAGLKSTAGAVGITSEELQKMAADLQKTSLFGDEDILKNVTAQLLTFTNIAQEQFEKTQVVAMDLATRVFDGNLKSASLMLGKALNDPVANLSALSRAGIQFSEEQKILIKSLAETGRMAEAQNVILAELERQYGGSAKAAREAGTGPIEVLTNQLSDLSEQIGERLVPHVQKFVGWVTKLAKKFDGLSESQKDNIVKWGLVVAAIGPALIIFGKIALGISSLITLFATLRTAVLATSGAFKALTLAMVKNPIGAVITLATSAAAAYFLLETNTKGATKAQKEFNGVTESTEDAIKRLSKSVGDMGKDSMQLQIEEIEKLIYDIKGFEIPAGASPFAPAGLPLTEKQQDQLKQLNGLLTKLKTKQAQAKKEADELAKSFENLGEKTEYLGEETENNKKVYKALNIELAHTKKINEELIPEKSTKSFEEITGWVTKLTKEQELMNAGFGMFGDVLTSSLDDALSSQQKFFPIFIANIKKAIQSLLVQLAVMTALSAIMPASLGGKGAKAFSRLNILENLGKIMGFAEGGLVTGPTVGLIGEGIGTTASNPEVIAPLDKLKNFIGGGSQNVIVEGVIKGNDIFLSNRNTGTNRQRSV